MIEDADSRPTDRPVLPVAVLILASLLLPLAAPRAAAQSLRYTRPLDVPEAGWVRSPLGPETLRRTGAGGGFRLFGPEGEEIPFRRVAARTGPLRRGVAAGAPAAADGGWWLPLEVPPGPRLHERLLLELDAPEEGEGAPPGEVRLEGSADGETWRLLVKGELSPVPGAAGRFALSYPATDLVRLRLFWPRRDGAERAGPGAGPGGVPRIARAAAVEVPPGSSRLSLARPECRAGEPSEAPSGATRTVCRLPLGGVGQHLRHLCLLVTSGGPAGYRLLDARDGRWETVAEGVWDLAGLAGEDVPRCLRVDLRLADGSAESEALRLELYGAGDDAPAVREASAELAPEELVFRARRAGVHTLAYGPAVLAGGGTGDPSADGPPPPRAQSARVEPGPEEATEVPVPAPALLAAAAAPAPAVAWRETWAVTAEAPEPGRLVRLTLPEGVYGVARPGLPDLRLLRGGASSSGASGRDQLPFVRWRPRTPELAAERRGVALRGEERRSAGLESEVRGLPLSALVATALPRGGQGFRHRVRVRWSEAGDGLDAGEEGAVDAGGGEDADARGELSSDEGDVSGVNGVSPWVEWVCRPRPPLPCRVTLVLDDVPARRVALEVDAGSETALPAVGLELWRRRDVLLFAWPAEGSGDAAPALVAGAADVAAPEPVDAEAEGGLAGLLARPWSEATLAIEGEAADGSGRLGRWAITLALAAALFTLLYLLHRILGEQARRRPGG
jgi:hypothetical protein